MHLNRLLTATTAVFVATAFTTTAFAQDADEMIASAITAGPTSITDNATIADLSGNVLRGRARTAGPAFPITLMRKAPTPGALMGRGASFALPWEVARNPNFRALALPICWPATSPFRTSIQQIPSPPPITSGLMPLARIS